MRETHKSRIDALEELAHMCDRVCCVKRDKTGETVIMNITKGTRFMTISDFKEYEKDPNNPKKHFYLNAPFKNKN